MRVFIVIAFTSLIANLMAPEHAKAGSLSLLRQTCLTNLCDIQENIRNFKARGWTKHAPVFNFPHPLIGPIIHSLKKDNAFFFSSPDNTQLFLLGESDNDLYPNMEWLFWTSEKTFPVKALMRKLDYIFGADRKNVRQYGKRKQVTSHHWSVGTFERNVSDSLRFNQAVIDIWNIRRRKPSATLKFNVIEMLPR